MINFYNKTKYGIVLLLVLSMILQVAGPLVNYAYGEEGDTPIVKNMTEEEDESKDSTETAEPENSTGTDEETEKDEETLEPEQAIEEDIIGPTEEGKDGEITTILSEPKDLGNIFTLISLKVNEEEASENMVVTIEDGTTVTLDYIWDTVGKDAKLGDWSEIDIPDAFKLDTNFEDKDIVLNSGETVGTYSIIGNKLRFVFNQNIETGEVKNGTLGFGVKFNEEKFKTDVVEEIEFKDVGEKTITIIGKNSGTISAISKIGVPDSDKDAKKITWTVDISNPSTEAITNAKFKDIIPEGLTLVSSDVKITNLTIGLDGKLNEGTPVQVIPEIDGQNFELSFAKIAPYKGYRIDYTTTITDYSKTEFKNEAALEYGNERLPAEATVSVKRSGGIEKYGEYKNNDVIEWWIDVNKSGGIINEAIVEDALPEGVTLVPASIAIVKLSKNGNNWTESPSDKTATEFPVNLGTVTSDDAYRIRFKTKIDYSQVNKGDYQNTNSFKTLTKLYDGKDTVKIGEADKTVTVTRKPILSKTGKPNVDYKNKQIKWTVTVNEANHPIDNAVVTDTLPAGLSIVNDDIIVKDSKGVPVTEGIIITINPEPSEKDKTTTVTIKLGDITNKYTIEYTTTIIDFTKDEFINNVSLRGTGVGTGETISEVSVKPPNNSYDKKFNSINYNDKTMKWTITANPTREAISELTITDTFPNKGLILLENTLKVVVGTKTLLPGTDYKLTARIEDGVTGYQKGFIIEFKKTTDSLPINAEVVITYTTSYDPAKGIDDNISKDGKYINKANFNGKTINGNPINIDKEANHTVNPETINSGKKVGKLISTNEKKETVDGWVSGNTRKIRWEVYINYLEQNLGTDVTVTDLLGYEGVIDPDSIKVKEYTVAGDGNTTPGTNPGTNPIEGAILRHMQLLAEQKYTVKMNEANKGFTLSFDQVVDKRYVIIFDTSVPYISQKVYTNTATVKVGNKDYPYTGSVEFKEADKNLSKEALVTGGKVYTDDEIDWKITINKGLSIIQRDVKVVDTISKGLVYKEGSLKLFKYNGKERVSADDEISPLIVKNLEDGKTELKIEFKNEISSTYEIEYTTVVSATGGTVNNKVDYSGKNLKTNSVTTTELKAEQFSYVGGEWDPSKGKIIINKTDTEGVLITAEAEFEVFYMLNGKEQLVEGKTYKTKNGTVEIGNLKLNRTYYIKEISAPNGFKIDENKKPIEVIVDEAVGKDNSGAYSFKINNNNIKTQMTVEKVWVDGPVKKPTIKLQLYRNREEFGSPVELLNGTTSYTWTNLNLTDNSGKEYEYTVDEIEVPSGFKKQIRISGLITIITNSYEVEEEEITGTKVWIGGPEIKPTIKLQLYQNGEKFGSQVELKNGTTSHTWGKLPKTDKFGNLYVYTVDELNGPDNYEQNKKSMYGKSRSADGLTVTNTYKSPKTDVTGRKVWNNGPEVKPTIELQLYRNDIALGNPVELTNGTYEYVWKDLDITDNDGIDYEYTVKEVKTPENYTKVEEGLTVTNTYVSPKTEVTGIKVWVGGPAVKPTIELQLYRNGKALGKSITLEDGETTYTWEGLDLTDENGINYVYAIQEVNVPKNYEKSEEGLTVTNTYVSPKTEVIGTKKWLYGPSIKPTIELQLYRNGVALEDYKVELENGKTEYKWTNLDLTDEDGVEYVYTIDEVNTPENYGKSRSEDKLTVTNTYVSPITEITGRKVWIGGSSIKPTIELQLYRDGEALGLPVELKNGETEYTWTELDRTYINGVEYVYTVDEVKVPSSYRKTISENGLTITNRYNSPYDPEEPYNPEVPLNSEGRIKIVKKDNKTNELLSGAEFNIVDSRGRRVDTLRTNFRGEATSKWLPIGNYTIEEVKAPEGYKLETTLGQERVRTGETFEVVIYNEKEEEPVDQTDSEDPTEPEDPTAPEDSKEPTILSEDDEFEDVNGGNPSDKPEGEDEFEDGGGKNPSGKPKLPKTGSASPIFLYGLGGLSILLGAMLRRKED